MAINRAEAAMTLTSDLIAIEMARLERIALERIIHRINSRNEGGDFDHINLPVSTINGSEQSHGE